MDKPAISVIMAIYNKAATLDRSIRSVLAQTFGDFELLLVDDGSNDVSLAICRKYAQTDCRIRVIHQDNAGVSAARQIGISSAHGTYSIHVDPDDWIDPQYFEQMYRMATQTGADIVISDFFVDNEEGTSYKSQKPTGTDHGQVLEDLFGHLHGSVCNKLIRHACYSMYGIAFPENLNYCEDFIVCASLFMRPVRVAYLNGAFYHYDCSATNDSLTKGFTRSHLEASIRVVEALKERLGRTEQHNRLIGRYEQKVKFLAFENRLLTAEEFRRLFPSASSETAALRTSLVNRLLYRGACLGCYGICSTLLHAKNRLRRNNLR